MLIVIPKEVTERKENIKKHLERESIKIAMEYGVPYSLVKDSIDIDESLNCIANRINKLHETIKTCGTNTNITNMDETWFKPVKDCKPKESTLVDIKRLKKFSKNMEKIDEKEKTEIINLNRQFSWWWDKYKRESKKYDSTTTPRKACWNFFNFLKNNQKVNENGKRSKN